MPAGARGQRVGPALKSLRSPRSKCSGTAVNSAATAAILAATLRPDRNKCDRVRPDVDGTQLTQGVSRMIRDFDHLMSARADALFVSHLSAQHSPTRIEVEMAIRQAVRAHGGTRGCAGEVAAEYGAHPETAAPRMRWARAVVDNLFLQSRLTSLEPAMQAAGVDSSASVGVS
jgi:hypothetical protein